MEPALAATPRLNPAPPPRTQPEAHPGLCPCGAPPARKRPRGREQLQTAAPEAEEEGRVLGSGGPDPARSVRSPGPPRRVRSAPPFGPGQRLLEPRPGPPAPPRRRRRATQLFRGLSLPGSGHGQGKCPGCQRAATGRPVSGAGQVLRTCSWYPLYWRRERACGHTLRCLGPEPCGGCKWKSQTLRLLSPGPVPGPASLLGTRSVNREPARKFPLATGGDVSAPLTRNPPCFGRWGETFCVWSDPSWTIPTCLFLRLGRTFRCSLLQRVEADLG